MRNAPIIHSSRNTNPQNRNTHFIALSHTFFFLERAFCLRYGGCPAEVSACLQCSECQSVRLRINLFESGHRFCSPARFSTSDKNASFSMMGTSPLFFTRVSRGNVPTFFKFHQNTHEKQIFHFHCSKSRRIFPTSNSSPISTSNSRFVYQLFPFFEVPNHKFRCTHHLTNTNT